MSSLQPLRRPLLMTFMIAALAFFWASPIARAATMPLTSAPPVEVIPYTSYTGYTYLSYSNVGMTDNGNQTSKISAVTQSKSVVSELGAVIQLQRWTGSDWVDIGSAVTIKAANSSNFSDFANLSTPSGYYYRGKVTHYAKQGATTESAVAYTSSLLVG
ncbi:hypothetical protein [Cohnella sp. AR92]|uniref:hypothetical protein n=1 Tax=Cohnella sp. AR92 TaxID=648716 RepID=UPI000F8ED08D|nr:hypothetical protein [Cohnella sp. AR92]RUS45754.1 hypothetical protein ELR57_18000 [Cohnella sp. AR92]